MVARVRLDASHVSGSVTARREKVTRYIRVLNELSEVRTFRLHFLRLRVIELTVRENLHGSLRFLERSCSQYLVIRSLTWALECDRPQRRRSVLLQVLEVDLEEGRRFEAVHTLIL